jgi:hypothetical protein
MTSWTLARMAERILLRIGHCSAVDAGGAGA